MLELLASDPRVGVEAGEQVAESSHPRLLLGGSVFTVTCSETAATPWSP